MKRSYLWAVWLWAVQAATGALLVLYIVIHTIDNGTILVSRQAFDDMLKLWHEGIPKPLYDLMVIGLVGVFVLHMLNGIRIASKPYKEVDKSWRHAWMLKHTGTTFWFAQVLSGSVIAIFGVWHMIVQHALKATTTAPQSADRMSMIVYLVYLIFLAGIMFHSFNGVRAVIVKLGYMTDKMKEGILTILVALACLVFFFVGAVSMGVFLTRHDNLGDWSVTDQAGITQQQVSPPEVAPPNEQLEPPVFNNLDGGTVTSPVDSGGNNTDVNGDGRIDGTVENPGGEAGNGGDGSGRPTPGRGRGDH
jgi:succinate dehydrogenase/fumarate reductase cytochrome b subunit